MKTVIAAFVVFTLAAVLPSSASEPSLRGMSDVGSAQPAGKDAKVESPATDATPAKKIRVVLASPYGN